MGYLEAEFEAGTGANHMKGDAPFYIAIGTGLLLTLIPEPATTATGLAILAGVLGAKYIK